MKVVLSTGYGRLHLLSSAESLAKAGCEVVLFCGWVPKRPNGLLVRFCSRLIGRDLSYGMRKRSVKIPGVTVVSFGFADFLDQGLRLINQKFLRGRFADQVATLGWRMFGWCSARRLRRMGGKQLMNCIFHVRSGAGCGGAVEMAKRLGMKVVVDHSIAHPAFMERQIMADCERFGVKFDMGMDSRFWRQVLEDCRKADVIQVNSEFVKDTFVEQGFPADKIRVVYLGQREDFFGVRRKSCQTQGCLKLLFTGGFGFRKGGEYILEAMRILKERGVDYEMAFVGDKSSVPFMMARYREYDLPLTFHGPKPQDELKSFLANGDIYVFPSLAEGCAQSGMEAMAAGLCVIASHESGLPIVDGETGFIIPSKDAKAVADRIAWLASHRDVIDRIGANAARLMAAKYSWARYAENTKACYGMTEGMVLA